jgi:hypothetical protein
MKRIILIIATLLLAAWTASAQRNLEVGAIFDGKVARVQIVIQAINDEWGSPIEYEIPVN